MPRYSDKFRAGAVVMLESQGYPDREGALTAVSNELRVPKSTLHRWFKKKQNPPDSEMVTEKRIDFTESIRNELAGIFQELPDARMDADYRALMTGVGILIDKLQLLEGKPTEHRKLSGGVTVSDMSDDELDSILYAGGNPRGEARKTPPPIQ